MITCMVCKKFAKATLVKRRFDNDGWHIGYIVEGNCKKCGNVECDYDDFEELEIEE